MASIMLDRIQAGRETTRGTLVQATRKVKATAYGMDYERTLAARPTTTGTFRRRRYPSYSRAMGRLSMTDVLTFENAPWWFYNIFSEDVAAVGDAGSPEAFTREFFTDTDDDTMASISVEGYDRDTPYTFAQAMVNEWNLRWDSDSNDNPDWMLEVTMPTLAPQTGVYTAGLTEIQEETIKARGTKIYIDDGMAIGSSQRTGQLISGSISGSNNLEFPAYAEDEFGPPANHVIRGEITVDAQLVIAFQNDDDFADFRADNPIEKKIRFERLGAAAIHGAVFPRFRADLYGFWSAIAWGNRGNERTVTLSLMTFEDFADAVEARFEVVNDLDDPIE